MKFKKFFNLLIEAKEDQIRANVKKNLSKVDPQDLVDILGGDITIQNARSIVNSLIDDLRIEDIYKISNKIKDKENDQLINSFIQILKRDFSDVKQSDIDTTTDGIKTIISFEYEGDKIVVELIVNSKHSKISYSINGKKAGGSLVTPENITSKLTDAINKRTGRKTEKPVQAAVEIDLITDYITKLVADQPKDERKDFGKKLNNFLVNIIDDLSQGDTSWKKIPDEFEKLVNMLNTYYKNYSKIPAGFMLLRISSAINQGIEPTTHDPEGYWIDDNED